MKTFSISKTSFPFVSKEALRSYATCAQFLPIADDKALLVSTNGFALACINVPFEGDDKEPCLLNLSALQAAAKMKNGVVQANGGENVVVKDRLSSSEFAKPNIDYPDWTKVVPEKKPSRRITLNADFLFDLAKSLDKNCSVCLHITDDDLEPIVVTGNNGFGVICPIESSEANERFDAAASAISKAAIALSK
jgi:hypothetical protein